MPLSKVLQRKNFKHSHEFSSVQWMHAYTRLRRPQMYQDLLVKVQTTLCHAIFSLSLPLATSQGMSSHMPLSQCAVCQGSGSNWLTSCCYFLSPSLCLSLFFHTFPKPWQDSRATAAFAVNRRKKILLCTRVKVFFFFQSEEKYTEKSSVYVCLHVGVRKFLPLGENMAIHFSFRLPSQAIRLHSFWGFIAYICTYFPVSFDFPVLLPATCPNTTVYEFHGDWLLLSCTE